MELKILAPAQDSRDLFKALLSVRGPEQLRSRWDLPTSAGHVCLRDSFQNA
jgi:hypothetical protein